MRSSDISYCIIIIIIFICLYLINIFSIGIKHMKKDWPLYRCNPAIMPFVGFLGHDASTNLTYCIQNMQTNFMGELLKPLNYNVDILGQTTEVMGNSLDNTRHLIKNVRSNVAGNTGTMFSSFTNVIIAIQETSMNLKDMFAKLAGSITGIVYSIRGGILGAQSWPKTIPGTMLRTIAKVI